MNDFIKHCQITYPNLHSRLNEHFKLFLKFKRGLSEFTVDAYLYYHLPKLFPEISEVILFEKPLIGNRSDLGTADFICRTVDDKIMLIEVKFINLEASGHTAQTKRRKSRKKVIKQVQKWKRRLMDFYNVPEDQILCEIFTTDPISIWRAERVGISGKSISISELRNWLSTFQFVTLNI